MNASQRRWLLATIALGALSLTVAATALIRIRQTMVANAALSTELGQTREKLDSERLASAQFEDNGDQPDFQANHMQPAAAARPVASLPTRSTPRPSSRIVHSSRHPEVGDVIPPKELQDPVPKVPSEPKRVNQTFRIGVPEVRWKPNAKDENSECVVIVLSVTNLTDREQSIPSAVLRSAKGNSFFESALCLSEMERQARRRVPAHGEAQLAMGYAAPRAAGYHLEIGVQSVPVN